MGTGEHLGGAPDPAAAERAATWIEDLLTAVRAGRHGKKWQCPAHGATGEHSAALSVGSGKRGALVYCHSGCDTDDVLGALALERKHLYCPPPVPPALYARAQLSHLRLPPLRATASGNGRPEDNGYVRESEHAYGPDVWLVRYRHPTTGAKWPEWESINLQGRRVRGLLGRGTASLPLYRQDELQDPIGAGDIVVLCESESSVDALYADGIAATTWAGGADGAKGEILARLIDVLAPPAEVVIVPDHDVTGLRCRDRLVAALPQARVVLGERGEDARDILIRLGVDALRLLLTAWDPADDQTLRWRRAMKRVGAGEPPWDFGTWLISTPQASPGAQALAFHAWQMGQSQPTRVDYLFPARVTTWAELLGWCRAEGAPECWHGDLRLAWRQYRQHVENHLSTTTKEAA